MELIEKVTRLVSTIVENDDKNGFSYFEEMMNENYSNDPDFLLIKEKMDNLISLMFKIKQESEEEFEKFIDLDFEEEVWNMI